MDVVRCLTVTVNWAFSLSLLPDWRAKGGARRKMKLYRFCSEGLSPLTLIEAAAGLTATHMASRGGWAEINPGLADASRIALHLRTAESLRKLKGILEPTQPAGGC